uniref:Mitochondrial poly(A) polymerase n=1 Tax=Oncorhynchus kisutch TaxID=8019 RepID=A0A8C7KGN5_ONCKI
QWRPPLACRLCMRGSGSLSTLPITRFMLSKKDRWIRPTFPLEPKEGDKYFYTLQEERIEQAERSVLISCPAKTNNKKLLKYLSRHGNINTFYIILNLGFTSKESLTSLHEMTIIPSIDYEATVPFESRLLSLKKTGPVDLSNRQSASQCQPQTTIPINDLIQRLSKEDKCLCFLVCSLLNGIAAAYFPERNILPSSMNGFRKLGCELDMFHDLDDINGRNLKVRMGMEEPHRGRTKRSERAATQSILSVIGECKILNARCPLVRFTHRPLGFQCDLTANRCNSQTLYNWVQVAYITATTPKIDGPFLKPVCFYVLSPLSFSLPPSFNLLRSPPLFSLLALTQGREQNKPEPALNVSKHVNRTQPEHFVALSRESAWMMQQREFKVPHSSGSNGTGIRYNAPWGLAVLLMHSVSQAASKRLEILLESLKNREEKKTGNSINTTRKKS